VTDVVSQGMSMRGSNTSKGEEGEGEFQVERDQSQLSLEHTTQRTCIASGRAVDTDATR